MALTPTIQRRLASTIAGNDWNLYPSDATGNTWSNESIQIILLQEIREELKTLNALLRCHNFTNIPTTLRKIARNTTKEKK